MPYWHDAVDCNFWHILDMPRWHSAISRRSSMAAAEARHNLAGQTGQHVFSKANGRKIAVRLRSARIPAGSPDAASRS